MYKDERIFFTVFTQGLNINLLAISRRQVWFPTPYNVGTSLVVSVKHFVDDDLLTKF